MNYSGQAARGETAAKHRREAQRRRGAWPALLLIALLLTLAWQVLLLCLLIMAEASRRVGGP